MTELAKKECTEVKPIISYDDIKAYDDLSKQIKTLESKKAVMNKKFKKAVGLSIIADIQATIKKHQDEVDEFFLLYEENLFGRLDEEELSRLGELETKLYGVNLTTERLLVARSGDPEAALKLGAVKIPVNDLRCDFCPQDRSKINEARTLEFLKSRGLSSLIITKEVPNMELVERYIDEGKIIPSEFRDECIDQNIVVTLTVRANKEGDE